MVELGDLPVEPEMHAGDGGSFEVGDLLAERGGVGSLRKDSVQRIEGQRQDEIVESRFRLPGLAFIIAVDEIKVNLFRIWMESFERTAEIQLAAAGADVVSGGVVKICERDGGNAHVARRGRLHGFADNLRGGRNRDAVQLLAEGADQDGLPETLDGAGCLVVLLQPVREGFSSVELLSERERDHGAGDRELVFGGQERKMQERRRSVQRSWEWGGAHDRGASTGFEERHGVVPADVVAHADALVEIDQVGAGAKQNVLAVVDDLAGSGMLVGGGASAEEGTLLENGDAETGVGQGTGGG